MNNQSLISKITSKKILIQYLDRKHLSESRPNIKEWPNPYLAVENIPSLLTSQQLNEILMIRDPKKRNAYTCYQEAFNLLIELDDKSAEEGNKGLALLNELRYCQSDLAIHLLVDEEENIEVDIGKFTIYSYIHNKKMTRFDLIESFGHTFRDFIIITDNILTLNFYLEEMVDVDELKCLKYLSQWFGGGGESIEGLLKQLNITQICYDNIFSAIVDQNHPEFVELFRMKANKKGYQLFHNFKEDSMSYVKNTIAEILH